MPWWTGHEHQTSGKPTSVLVGGVGVVMCLIELTSSNPVRLSTWTKLHLTPAPRHHGYSDVEKGDAASCLPDSGRSQTCSSESYITPSSCHSSFPHPISPTSTSTPPIRHRTNLAHHLLHTCITVSTMLLINLAAALFCAASITASPTAPQYEALAERDVAGTELESRTFWRNDGECKDWWRNKLCRLKVGQPFPLRLNSCTGLAYVRQAVCQASMHTYSLLTLYRAGTGPATPTANACTTRPRSSVTNGSSTTARTGPRPTSACGSTPRSASVSIGVSVSSSSTGVGRWCSWYRLPTGAQGQVSA